MFSSFHSSAFVSNQTRSKVTSVLWMLSNIVCSPSMPSQNRVLLMTCSVLSALLCRLKTYSRERHVSYFLVVYTINLHIDVSSNISALLDSFGISLPVGRLYILQTSRRRCLHRICAVKILRAKTDVSAFSPNSKTISQHFHVSRFLALQYFLQHTQMSSKSLSFTNYVEYLSHCCHLCRDLSKNNREML